MDFADVIASKDFGVGDVHVTTALNQPRKPTSRSSRAKRRRIKRAKPESFGDVITKFGEPYLFDAIIAKFSPDQPRAPKGDPKGGQWISTGQPDDPTGLEVYHGGTTANLQAILKQGLKPAPPGVHGADWLAEHVLGQPAQDIFLEGQERPKSVFFTESLTAAEGFANMLAGKAEQGTFHGTAAADALPVVLKIEIPASMRSSVLNDEAYGPNGRGAYRMEGTIKPEWIKGYMLPSDGQFHTGHRIDLGTSDRQLHINKDDAFTIYAVVFYKALVAKYSPDQPRIPAGQSGGGEWTGEAFRPLADLPVKIAGRPDAKFEADVKKEIDNLPPDLKELVEKNNLKVIVTDNISSVHPEAAGRHPVGYGDLTVDDAPGGFMPDDNELVLASGAWAGYAESGEPLGTLIYHEIGHAVDEYTGIAEAAPVAAAYVQDVANVTRHSYELDYFLPSGNPQGLHEVIAQVISDGYGHYSTLDPQRINSVFPRTAEAVASKLKPILPTWGSGLTAAKKASSSKKWARVGGFTGSMFIDGVRQIDDVAKYSPNQPRDPAGEPTGGQWTSGPDTGWATGRGDRPWDGKGDNPYTLDPADIAGYMPTEEVQRLFQLGQKLNPNKYDQASNQKEMDDIFLESLDDDPAHYSDYSKLSKEARTTILDRLDAALTKDRAAMGITVGKADTVVEDFGTAVRLPIKCDGKNLLLGRYHILRDGKLVATTNEKPKPTTKVLFDDIITKFSPDQPRVPAGQSGGGEWTVYHGSDQGALDDILKNGIKVGGAGKVYVTDDPQEALIFANRNVGIEAGSPIVFKIEVPPGDDFTYSPRHVREDASNYRSSTPIPPSWIRGYYTTPNGFHGFTLGEYHEVRKGDGKAYYVVVFLPTVAKFNPNHDEIGRFATAPGLPSKMMDAIKSSGGFTLEPRTAETPTTGFAVGGYDGDPIFDADKFSLKDVQKFLKDNRPLLANSYVGGWVDGGKVYLDVTKVFPDQESAVAAGKANNQISIADLSKIHAGDFDHAFIGTGGTGVGKAASGTMFLFPGNTPAEEIFNAMTKVAKHLGPGASAKDWIDDFIASDNPRFAGKSKEERRRMAIAAYEGAQSKKSWSIPLNITKAEPDQRMIFGWASVVEKDGQLVIDKQDEVIFPVDLENAAYDFVLNARNHGDNHDQVGTGRMIESMVFTKEKQQAMGIDLGQVGWWTGFKVDDDALWDVIKAGGRPEFSIGGSGRRSDYDEVTKSGGHLLFDEITYSVASNAVSFDDLIAKYSANQPRKPKGDPEGGEWTAGGGMGATTLATYGTLAAGAALAGFTPETVIGAIMAAPLVAIPYATITDLLNHAYGKGGQLVNNAVNSFLASAATAAGAVAASGVTPEHVVAGLMAAPMLGIAYETAMEVADHAYGRTKKSMSFDALMLIENSKKKSNVEKYSPKQPRHPKGTPEGGKFAPEKIEGESLGDEAIDIAGAAAEGIASDPDTLAAVQAAGQSALQQLEGFFGSPPTHKSFDDLIVGKFNPHHQPAGSSIGGQFAPSGSTSDGHVDWHHKVRAAVGKPWFKRIIAYAMATLPIEVGIGFASEALKDTLIDLITYAPHGAVAASFLGFAVYDTLANAADKIGLGPDAVSQALQHGIDVALYESPTMEAYPPLETKKADSSFCDDPEMRAALLWVKQQLAGIDFSKGRPA